jgi:hypothetical protein
VLTAAQYADDAKGGSRLKGQKIIRILQKSKAIIEEMAGLAQSLAKLLTLLRVIFLLG